MDRSPSGAQAHVTGRGGHVQAARNRTLYFFLLLLSSGVLLHLSNWRWLDIYYYQELVTDPHVTEVLKNLKLRLTDPHVSEVLNTLKLRLNDPHLERAMRALTMKLPCPPCEDSVLSSTYCSSLDHKARELECPETRCSCLPYGMTNRDYNMFHEELTALRLNSSANFLQDDGCPKCYCPSLDGLGKSLGSLSELTCEELQVKSEAKHCSSTAAVDLSSMGCTELQTEMQTKQCPLPDVEGRKLDCAALQSEMQANLCPGTPGVDIPPPLDCPPAIEKPCPPQQPIAQQPSTFRDNLFNGVVRGYGPHQWRYLEREIRRKDLVPVFLDYHHPSGPSDAIHLQCRGNECPRFGKCAAKDYKRIHGENLDANAPGFAKLANSIWTCWNSDLEDRALNKSKPPVNFPANGPQDIQLLQPWAGQVMVLHNVYINEKGQVFDEKHHFDRNGCAGDMDYMHPVRTVVAHYKDLLSLAYWNGGDTYHALVEILPLFVSMQHVFESLPGIPVAVRHDQMFFMRDYMQPLLGMDVARLNMQPVARGKLFFVERLILPIYQWCGRPSHIMWSYLRKNYIMPSAAKHLPYAITGKTEADWRAEPAISGDDDWVVILVKRPAGKARVLIQHEELHKALVYLFTAERVVVFDGSIGAGRARLLFMRAKLVVGVHGSGMANMIFMPSDSAVLEIRPRQLRNWRYHMLSEACSLRFFLVFGDGSRDSPTDVKVPVVITAAIEAARSFLPVSLLPPLSQPPTQPKKSLPPLVTSLKSDINTAPMAQVHVSNPALKQTVASARKPVVAKKPQNVRPKVTASKRPPSLPPKQATNTLGAKSDKDGAKILSEARNTKAEMVKGSDGGDSSPALKAEVVKAGGDSPALKAEDTNIVPDLPALTREEEQKPVAEADNEGALVLGKEEAKEEAPELVSQSDSEQLAAVDTETEPEGLVTETKPEEEGKEKR